MNTVAGLALVREFDPSGRASRGNQWPYHRAALERMLARSRALTSSRPGSPRRAVVAPLRAVRPDLADQPVVDREEVHRRDRAGYPGVAHRPRDVYVRQNAVAVCPSARSISTIELVIAALDSLEERPGARAAADRPARAAVPCSSWTLIVTSWDRALHNARRGRRSRTRRSEADELEVSPGRVPLGSVRPPHAPVTSEPFNRPRAPRRLPPALPQVGESLVGALEGIGAWCSVLTGYLGRQRRGTPRRRGGSGSRRSGSGARATGPRMGSAGCRSCGCPRRRPIRRGRASGGRSTTTSPAGAKTIAASSSSGISAAGPAHSAPRLARKVAACSCLPASRRRRGGPDGPRPGRRCGRSRRSRRARCARRRRRSEGAVADEACAKKRRLGDRVAGRQREGVAGVRRDRSAYPPSSV